MEKEHSDVRIKIGINILKYRRHNDLSQEQLADIVSGEGISRNYMQRIERGGSCSLDTLIEIAKALNVPLYKLFVFEEDTNV